MTVSTSTTRKIYDGDGTTTTFPYTWKITDSSHLTVVHTNAAGTETTWSENTQYTVTGVDNGNGGNVVVESAYKPATGTKLTIYLYVPFTQETDYEENDAFPAETHEEALDKLTRQNLYQEDVIDRCVKIPVSDSTSIDTELPSATSRASKLLGFDSSGNMIATNIADTTNFYNKSQLDGGILNSLYYTEDEVDTLISGVSFNLVDDTTPQLGGNLELNDKNVVYGISNTNSFTTTVSVSGATSAYQALYITSGGTFALADCSASGTMPARALSTVSGTGSNSVYLSGVIKNTGWSWTPGTNVYVSTSGSLTQSTVSSGVVQCVGYAISTNTIFLNCNDMFIGVD